MFSTLKKAILLVCIFTLGLNSSFADDDFVAKIKPKWSISLEDQYIYHVNYSPNKKFVAYYTEDDDANLILITINLETGKQAWKKVVKDLPEEFYFTTRFISDDVLFTCDENKYYFINSIDGKVIKTLDLFCESFEDVTSNESKMQQRSVGGLDYTEQKPWFIKQYAFFFGEDGFQILNLSEQEFAYQSGCESGALFGNEIGDLLMLTPFAGIFSGIDSIYYFDYHKGRIINKFVNDDGNELNTRLHIRFASHGNRMITFNEEHITLYDLKTMKEDGKILFDLMYPEYVGPIIMDNHIYVVSSEEDVQTLYDGESGKVVFKLDEGKIPGIIEEISSVGDGFLIFSYDNDNSIMSLSKVDKKSGQLKWRKELFEYDGEYETGHRTMSAGEQFMRNMVAHTVSSILSGGRNNTRFGHSYGIYRNPLYEDIYDGLKPDVFLKKVASGYAQVIALDEKTITLGCFGEVQRVAGSGDFEEETVVKINLQDGEIIDKIEGKFYTDMDTENIIKTIETYFVGENKVVVAEKSVLVISNTGFYEIKFDDFLIKFLGFGQNALFVKAEDEDEEILYYWKLDFSGSKPTKTLLARTDEFNIFQTNYHLIKHRIDFMEEEIKAFDLQEGELSTLSFENPIWSTTVDELGFGDLDLDTYNEDMKEEKLKRPEYSFLGDIHGVKAVEEGLFFMGTDALAFISHDGKCKWSHEWYPDYTGTNLGVIGIDGFWVYSTAGDTEIISRDCKGEALEILENDIDNTYMAPIHNGVFILAEEEYLRFYSK